MGTFYRNLVSLVGKPFMGHNTIQVNGEEEWLNVQLGMAILEN